MPAGRHSDKNTRGGDRSVTPSFGSVQELIEGVQGAMGTDTATLLLADRTGTVLQPVASAGLGRRWRGAPYIKVGTGFAGRVAAGGEPVVVTDVNGVTVLNPVLREAGVQRLLGVPVPGPRGLLGVLHVGSLTPRSFNDSDVRRLQQIAADIGRRLSEQSRTDSHFAALVLQRSLLPAVPPAIPGLDVAVRYLPAEGDLGGDWYDVFPLPSGRVGIVLGDVEGHDLESAVVMGRLRSALRAYALDHDDPAEVLHRLDRKFCYFEGDVTATVVYAVTEPPFDRVTICSAGHPAPIIARPGEPCAEVVDISAGVLLGLDPDQPRQSDTIAFTAGGVLAFFTDGLVERRDRGRHDSDPYGARLDRVLRTLPADESAEAICSTIIATSLGDDSAEDDVALVVVRRTP
jgi:serine phosphatase RsbU (regulator of sigma subunit)